MRYRSDTPGIAQPIVNFRRLNPLTGTVVAGLVMLTVILVAMRARPGIETGEIAQRQTS